MRAAQEHTQPGSPRNDVVTSLTEILNYPSALHRQVAAQQYFESLDASRFPAVLAELVKLQATRGECAAEEFFRVWVRRNPGEAAASLAALPRSESSFSLGFTFVRLWSRLDLEAAKAWVGTIRPDESLFAGSERSLKYALWAGPAKPIAIDPRVAFDKYVSDGKSDVDGLTSIFSEWGKVDPAAASKAILSIQTDSDRDSAIRSFLRSWGSIDPRSALAWVQEHVEATRHSLDFIASDIAQKDLELLKQAAASSQDSLQRAVFGAEVAIRLASTDLDAAIAYLETMAAADRRYATGVYRMWAEKDPAAAVSAFQALYPQDDSFAKEQLMYSQAVRSMLTRAIAKDPRAVAAAVLELDAQTRAEVLRDIGKWWCQTDGMAAAAWAAALPTGPARDETIRQFLSAWGEHDSTQPTAFINSLPAGSAKSAAAEGFATAIFPMDPDAALAWIHTIPDEKERLAALKRAYLPWRNSSGTQNFTWRATSPALTKQERAAISDSVLWSPPRR